FSNWPSLLTGVVRQKLGRGPDELVFKTRSGQLIVAPNVPGARVPVYEQFAEHGYELEWFLEAFRGEPVSAIDIGGHIGTFALDLLAVLPEATVVCYEPSSATIPFLKRNVTANGQDDHVVVVEAAVA